uniref:Uncharacterized protein n=1 Tax=Odontella aurita TaxID=265563 RepID=A0A7S4N073_9STRA|mmetsp:Transcript_42141/g.127846  ORF Transcript_42141/g.127846 Transcript_42141/m.127846 type:complete len:581 (+) Transcript_42141:269-2011(+)|eukprot:CAMPEP_0113556248 /NCGR_PEP_ID=MMETSP0015_2-20120614/17156_1 /TAXON_ID=2838 /ORGANISM="Odontella" /LENGTH=580 /DNA_ID=CAMNT_0000457593 /DNA_START=223 /DNA_END=1965 /DNA_ORIENTATION=- /assembly_acc=CAM_ASM_000160
MEARAKKRNAPQSSRNSSKPQSPTVDDVIEDVVRLIKQNKFTVYEKYSLKELNGRQLGVQFRTRDVPALVEALCSNRDVDTLQCNSFDSNEALRAFIDAAADEGSGMEEKFTTFYFCRQKHTVGQHQYHRVLNDSEMFCRVVKGFRMEVLCINECGISADVAIGIAIALRDNRTARIVEFKNEPEIDDTAAAAFADTLEMATCDTLHTLSFKSCGIGSDGAASLAGVLSTPNGLTELCLTGNAAINDAGAVAFATALEQSGCSLERLHLDKCSIGNAGCVAIGRALAQNEMMVALHLNDNPGIGNEGAMSLSVALERDGSKLEWLFLSQCSISGDGATALARALTHNARLGGLHLKRSRVDIGGDALIAFAESLRRNRTLHNLDLQGSTSAVDNDTYLRPLANALKRNDSLRTLSLKQWGDPRSEVDLVIKKYTKINQRWGIGPTEKFVLKTNSFPESLLSEGVAETTSILPRAFECIGKTDNLNVLFGFVRETSGVMTACVGRRSESSKRKKSTQNGRDSVRLPLNRDQKTSLRTEFFGNSEKRRRRLMLESWSRRSRREASRAPEAEWELGEASKGTE